MRRLQRSATLFKKSCSVISSLGLARRGVASPASPGGTGQKTMKDFGFEHNTPNFNVNFAELPDDNAVGDVETELAKSCTIAELQGPWLVLSDKLQGEMFIDADGFAFYRPASNLGYGVGKVVVKDTSIGTSTFNLRLETYSYENVSANPPVGTQLVDVVGFVSVAKATKSAYETFTLNGNIVNGTAGSGGAPIAFNAAKLSPWDPATAAVFSPNEEVRQGFDELFPSPIRLTSHLARAGIDKPRSSTDAPKHTDLSPYKVGAIDSVYYIPNYVSKEEQQRMLDHLQRTPAVLKNKLTKRLVQEWGCSMCPQCNQSFLSDCNLPPWTEAVTDMLLFDGVYTPATFPNNVRIHEYEAGEGIAPHCDGPIYVPKVAILSLASTSVISFYSRREPYSQPMEHYNDTFRFDGEIATERPLLSVVLEPGSLIVFERDAYTHHPHGISDKPVDFLSPDVAGEVVNRHLLSDPNIQEVRRAYRVGVTVRNLLPRCNHHPERAEFNMKRAWQLFQQTRDLGFRQEKESPQPVAPAMRASSPSSVSSSSPHPPPSTPMLVSTVTTTIAEADVAALHKKIETLTQQQQELLQVVKELQHLVGNSAVSQASFQKETSAVLNHLSSTVLQLENNVEELLEKQ